MKPSPMRYRFLNFSLALILSLNPLLAQVEPEDRLKSYSQSQLEEELAKIDNRLQNLASFSMRGGIGSIGYRSFWEDPTQWIEIELKQAYKLDRIALVPCVWRHPTKGFQSESFPRSLRIWAGRDRQDKGSIIAEFNQMSETPWGIAPLVLSLAGKEASWIRIEADELSMRSFDGNEVLQLSEIMVFSGTENVALHRPVKCSSSDERGSSGAWHKRFLVDGCTPYLMDSAVGTGSNAFLGWVTGQANLTVDLGSPQTISLIQIHAIEQSNSVPQAYTGDLGIPDLMLIEGANTGDFSDAVTLHKYRKESVNLTGPIIFIQIPETKCRYVRFTPVGVPDKSGTPVHAPRLGFSEIEIFSDRKNVALGRPVASQGLNLGHRTLAALTDGENFYGHILPLSQWMSELAERGQLELKRPIVLAELNSHYERQRNLLHLMILLAGLLALAIGASVLIGRRIRRNKVMQIRERIAADLHDDLGANIHTIGLITDMAKKSVDSKEELIELLGYIHDFTEESGESVRRCTNILEARGVCENLVEEMARFSGRLLADVDHQMSVEGEEILQTLAPHKRIDIFLFYKESLTNILRHSGATKVQTKISARPQEVILTVTDNGIGMNLTDKDPNPRSLTRRANLLGAKVTTEHLPAGGTAVILKLKTSQTLFFYD